MLSGSTTRQQIELDITCYISCTETESQSTSVENYQKHASKKLFAAIYFSHFHSHLQYGLLTWGSTTSKKCVNELFKLQKACVKLIVRNTNKPIDEMFCDLKILKITEMIQLELAKFGCDITKAKQPEPVQKIMGVKRRKESALISNTNEKILHKCTTTQQ